MGAVSGRGPDATKSIPVETLSMGGASLIIPARTATASAACSTPPSELARGADSLSMWAVVKPRSAPCPPSAAADNSVARSAASFSFARFAASLLALRSSAIRILASSFSAAVAPPVMSSTEDTAKEWLMTELAVAPRVPSAIAVRNPPVGFWRYPGGSAGGGSVGGGTGAIPRATSASSGSSSSKRATGEDDLLASALGFAAEFKAPAAAASVSRIWRR
mmetsp:Transcript_23046/g.70567  ORF Transcript_23046/g.70567 Transcript_23046/m.70567 type:complete len:220 (-) Transcript_23046:868-1527(-)